MFFESESMISRLDGMNINYNEPKNSRKYLVYSKQFDAFRPVCIEI